MIGTENIGVNICRNNLALQIFAHDKIVNAPTGILFARLEAITPPGIYLFHTRMLVTPGVYKARSQKLIEFSAFFVGKARIAAIGFGIFQVNFRMGHIEVATSNDRFFSLECTEIIAPCVIPLHTVIKTHNSL